MGRRPATKVSYSKDIAGHWLVITFPNGVEKKILVPPMDMQFSDCLEEFCPQWDWEPNSADID